MFDDIWYCLYCSQIGDMGWTFPSAKSGSTSRMMTPHTPKDRERFITDIMSHLGKDKAGFQVDLNMT